MYRLTAISKAAGMLSSRMKSIKRGYQSRNPHLSKPMLVSCYGFKIEGGNLIIHLEADSFESIPLNHHTLKVLSDPELRTRSFNLTERSLSLCISREVRLRNVTRTMGVDRNLRNLSVGDDAKVTQYDISNVMKIGDTTRMIVSSFRRKDVRVGRKVTSKYGRRRSERIKRIIHCVSKDVVKHAKEENAAIVFENIAGIRSLYRKGNGQGPAFRGRMNEAPWGEIKRQIEYKAAWEGIPTITLSRGETEGTTMDCPRCGERLQAAARGDGEHHRMLWCQKCGRWTDRDVVAVMNISHRGRLRFDRSKGEAGEAMRGNPTTPVILRVDASKPSDWRGQSKKLAEP